MMNGYTMKWARFRALSRPDRRLVVAAAAVWLPSFWFGLRVLGLRRFQARLRCDDSPAGHRLTREEVIRIATLVNLAARHAPFPATCLTRSMLLDWILRRRGIASRLHIGVRLTQGVLDAHAWVEYEGVPINDDPDVGRRFAAFAEVPHPGAFRSP
jgi:hypothetical protein